MEFLALLAVVFIVAAFIEAVAAAVRSAQVSHQEDNQ